MRHIAIAMIALVLAACDCACSAPSQPKTSRTHAILISGDKTFYLSSLLAAQYCYQGFVYVKFSYGDSAWGSIMYDKETNQPKTCDDVVEKH
jgi:hypothetical protein